MLPALNPVAALNPIPALNPVAALHPIPALNWQSRYHRDNRLFAGNGTGAIN